jgi:hypothetical protein
MPTARIICIGDTLVKGDDATLGGARTFRGRLQSALTNGNYDWNFVGTQSDAPAGGGDPDHEGYAGAFIDSTGSAGNNIASRISTILAAPVGVDIIIVLVGWADVIAGTSSIGTKYDAMVNSIVAAKPSAKIFLCTLPPYYNLTESATNGAYGSYATLNTTIRAHAGTSNQFVIDLAALAGGSSSTERAVFVDRVIAETKRQSDSLVAINGSPYSDPYAGSRFLDHAGVVAIMAASNPPGTGLLGIPGSDYLTNPDILGRDHFHQNVSQIMPWVHAYPGPSHAAFNTGVEMRNLTVMVLRTDGVWVEMIAGARVGGLYWRNNQQVGYSVPAGCTFRQQPDGITSFWRSANDAAYSMEGWPVNRADGSGVGFTGGDYHGVNRSAMANAASYLCVFQARLALDDPQGTNDIARAQYLMRVGIDFQVVNAAGYKFGVDGAWGPRYDYYGFPYIALDVGGGRNAFFTSTEWTTFGFVTIQEQGYVAGLNRPWYTTWVDSPYGMAPYGRTEAQIRANPPPLPSRWTFTTTGSGFSVSDYAGTTFLLAQSGADRIAQEMYNRMVASGELATYVSTGVTAPVLATGISTSPRYADRQTGGLWTYADSALAATLSPSWVTDALPPAVAGVAYAVSLLAAGAPAPTYSIVSGAPAWLTINATTGQLGGTPPAGVESLSTIVFRATGAGTADLTVILRVQVGPAITTTTLPAAITGQAYSVFLEAAGNGPFTWSLTAGALPTGLSLAGSTITGTATGTTQTFTLRVDTPSGFATRVFTLTVAAPNSVPVVNDITPPVGNVGSSYTVTFTAVGTGPFTWSIVSGVAPPGTTLNTGTGTLTSGNLTLPGLYTFDVQAANASGSGTRRVTVQVLPAGGIVAVGSPWARYLSPGRR